MSAEHPYSPAYDDDGVVYVSGALSVDVDGVAVGGRRTALDAAIAKLRSRLATVGLDLPDVVKTTYFVTDVSLRDEANEQYVELAAAPRPGGSFGAGGALPAGATVEREAAARRR